MHDIMKFIGISNFEELLVDGTGTNDTQTQQAIEIAKAKIEGVVEKIIL